MNPQTPIPANIKARGWGSGTDLWPKLKLSIIGMTDGATAIRSEEMAVSEVKSKKLLFGWTRVSTQKLTPEEKEKLHKVLADMNLV